MRMHEALSTIKGKVEYLLQNYPETRDSDKLLWLGYLVVFHDLKGLMSEETYQTFKKLILHSDTPTMESIRRMRQKFQEQGKYQGALRDERSKESEEVRKWAKNS